MKCPKCGFDQLPDTADYCTNCKQRMPTKMQIDVDQRAKELQGQLVGVQVGNNIYGGEFYISQAFVLTAAARREGAGAWDQFLKAKPPPYKFLAAYTIQDRALFFGREKETAEVLQYLAAAQVVVLRGRRGVGKTSLLTASVIPRLMEVGALTVYMNDYDRPLEQGIRDALGAAAEHIRLRLPEEAPLPKLVPAIVKAARGSLVLVLDQFERFLQSHAEQAQRQAFIDSLANTLKAVEPKYFRVILSVREEVSSQLAPWGVQLPGGLQYIDPPLQPLTRSEAQAAITKPLEALGWPVSFEGDLVSSELVPELDELTPEAECVEPGQLQIVCWQLYQAARGLKPPHISEKLYLAKAASDILATYAGDMLHQQLPDQEALAKRVLAALAAPTAGEWVAREQIPLNGSSPADVELVLQRLVGMHLLSDRAVDSRHEYSFSHPSVLETVRTWDDPQVKGCVQATDELKGIWAHWLACVNRPELDPLAGRGQLRLLAESGGNLRPSALQGLLLLRSAVARDEPTGPSLEWLGQDKNPLLIQQLETPNAVKPGDVSTPSNLDKAKRLLGLQSVELPPGKPYGSVAWAAVSHPNPKARQTAALALSVLNPVHEDGLERVDWALRDMRDLYQQRSRRAELHGALSDASPKLEEKIRKRDGGLPRLDRVWIEWWRARRRIFRDRQRIAVLTLGGAAGAGLGYGLLRAVSAAIIRLTVGAQFFIQSYVGAILGAALTLGLLLAKCLMSGQSAARETMSGEKPARTTPMTSPTLVAIGLGTLLFGIAHSTIATLTGATLTGQQLMARLLVAPLGFVAGLGLSLAVQGQPEAGWQLGAGRWLWRLGAAIVALLSTQLVFILGGISDGSIWIVWSGWTYHSELNRYPWWSGIATAHPQWTNCVSLLDAALVGLVLAIGTTAGLWLAARWLARWGTALSQLGD